MKSSFINTKFPIFIQDILLTIQAYKIKKRRFEKNLKIGKNVLVAPNAYVNFDVPDDSVVIGNPAKIIHKADATNAYINNILAI